MSSEEALKFYRKGKDLIKCKRYDDAYICLSSATHCDTKFLDAWYELGSLLLITGKISDALDAFNKVILLDPKNIEGWKKREATLLLMGAYDEALKCLDAIIEITHTDPNVWVDKGSLLFSLHKYKDALDCYEKALQLDPQLSIALKRKTEISRIISGTKKKIVEKITKKICLLGDPRVGKTSLIRRFVLDIFDENYISTIGAKIIKKDIFVRYSDTRPDVHLSLIIWDVCGQEDFQTIQKIYYSGTSGVIFVCDVLRKESLYNITHWQESIFSVTKKIPSILVVNKIDLGTVELSDEEISAYAKNLDLTYLYASAKTGENVNKIFFTFGRMILQA